MYDRELHTALLVRVVPSSVLHRVIDGAGGERSGEGGPKMKHHQYYTQRQWRQGAEDIQLLVNRGVVVCSVL